MHFTKTWHHILQNRHVRDLAWAIFSPSLLDHKSSLNVMQESFLGLAEDDIKKFIDHLKKLNQTPLALEKFLKDHPIKRLGDYFEHLIYYFLNTVSSCHKLEHHVVIKEREQTQGEFDFLFFSDQIGTTVHWEVCVKYYLLFGDKEDFASYIGPNPQDTLETKINSLKKQVALSKKTEGKRFLQKEHLLPLEAACLTKGYLFYPLQKDASFLPTATAGIAETHLYGFWDRIESPFWKQRIMRLSSENNNKEIRLYILPRLQWLASPTFEAHDTHFMQHSFICDSLPTNQLPLMLSLYLLKDDEWQEIERGILVSSKWPESP